MNNDKPNNEMASAMEAARRIDDWERRSTRGPGFSVTVSSLLLDDALTVARALLTTREEGWRTDVENAPKDGTQVLVFSGAPYLAYWNENPTRWEGEGPGWTVFEPDDYYYAIHLDTAELTHWRPLLPPKTGE